MRVLVENPQLNEFGFWILISNCVIKAPNNLYKEGRTDVKQAHIAPKTKKQYTICGILVYCRYY